MAKNVYIFGAGINRSFKGRGGHLAPLARDLFKQALDKPWTGYEGEPSWYKPIFDYIERYWKLTVANLKTEEFDLEELYTLLQLQELEARKNNNLSLSNELAEITSKLTTFFSNFLQKACSGIYSSPEFLALGRILWQEKAAVLTFNYDLLIEETIRCASGASGLERPSWEYNIEAERRPGYQLGDIFSDYPEDVVSYSPWKWEPFHAYGVHFDEILHPEFRSLLLKGESYFSAGANQAGAPLVLKMHGSLNWGRYGSHLKVSGKTSKPSRKIGATILGESSGMISEHMIKPLIITPMLYKALGNDSIFNQIWRRALSELRGCERLIIGGYSFPPTDFYTKKIFLEAFSERRPSEVIIINPDPDGTVEETVKSLVHVQPRMFKNLEEFISQYADHHTMLDSWDVKLAKQMQNAEQTSK